MTIEQAYTSIDTTSLESLVRRFGNCENLTERELERLVTNGHNAGLSPTLQLMARLALDGKRTFFQHTK